MKQDHQGSFLLPIFIGRGVKGGVFAEKLGAFSAVIGTMVTSLFGEWEIGLQILIACMALDYVMGLLCGYKSKELSSSIGFIGLKKKFTIIIILILAVLLD